jgi:hypothetical protein
MCSLLWFDRSIDGYFSIDALKVGHGRCFFAFAFDSLLDIYEIIPSFYLLSSILNK